MTVGFLNSKSIFFSKNGTLKLNLSGSYLNFKVFSTYKNDSLIWSIGILILQMYSKKEIKYIEENKSKILMKMKENSNDLISSFSILCNGCLKENPKKRISIDLILGLTKNFKFIDFKLIKNDIFES